MTESSPSSASETGIPQSAGQSAHLTSLGSNTVTADRLRQFRVFADLDDAQREHLISQMQVLTIPARTILLAAGQPGHAVYFLLEGTVKIGLERPAGPRTQKPFSLSKKELKEPVAATPATGAQVMLNLCGPGAILGELSVLDGRGHSASVTARATCRLLWIGKDAFLEAMDQIPGLSLALLRECSQRLRNATHQLHAFATLDAAGRIANSLLCLAERFGVETPEGVRLDINLMQPELADLTGLTRVSVNTTLAGFRKACWLELEPEGTLLLRDLDGLRRAAHQTSP